MNNPKIGRQDPEEIKRKIGASILIVSERLGIQVTSEEIRDLTRFVTTYFKDFAIEEIKLAFELLNARKFEIGERSGHFGVLSQAYVGEVLTSYRKYRVEETRKENIALGSLDSNQTRIDTPEEIAKKNFEALKRGVLASWAYFKEHNAMMFEPELDLVSANQYNFLRKIKVIPRPASKFANEVMREAETTYQKNINDLKARSTTTQIQAITQNLKRLGPEGKEKRIKELAKKIALRCFFEELALEEKQLSDLIDATE